MANESFTSVPSGVDPSSASPGSGGCATCHLAPGCLPGRLETGDIGRLLRIVRPLAPLRPQQPLFEDDSAGGLLYILRAGCIRTSVREASGSQAVIDFLLPGDAIGFGSLQGIRAIALERANVCSVRFADLEALAARLPPLQAQLHGLIERTLARNDQHVLMMGQRTAAQRVALFLLTWSGRRRAAGFSGTELDLPMGREDLASYLGLVSETTSRAVSRLQASELIEVNGRHHLRLLDANGLADLAGTGTGAGAQPPAMGRAQTA